VLRYHDLIIKHQSRMSPGRIDPSVKKNCTGYFYPDKIKLRENFFNIEG